MPSTLGDHIFPSLFATGVEEEAGLKPVDWVLRNPDELRHIISDWSTGRMLVGVDWYLAWEFLQEGLVPDLFGLLNQVPTNSGRRELCVFSLAAFSELQPDPVCEEEDIDDAVAKALEYLETPKLDFPSGEGAAIVLAHSAHFLLDPVGFYRLHCHIHRFPDMAPGPYLFAI